MDDTGERVEVRPVVPDDKSGPRGFAWRPRPVDDEDRYRGRRRRPGRFDVRGIAMMVATAVAGCVLLVLGVWVVRPAGGHPPVSLGRSAGTGDPPIEEYPSELPPPDLSPSASPKPSAKASATTTAPPAVPQPPPPGPGQPPPAAPPPEDATSPPAGGTTYEAESGANSRGGAVGTRTIRGTSIVVIGNIGNSPANTLTFNGVTVPSAGTHALTIAYVAGSGPRSATLSVNGGAALTVDFAGTPDWSTVATKTISVDLAAGANTLKFGNPTDWAPDLDSITVR